MTKKYLKERLNKKDLSEIKKLKEDIEDLKKEIAVRDVMIKSLKNMVEYLRSAVKKDT